jgi:hypothetical protein
MAYICGSLSHEVGFLFRRTIYPTVNVQKKREPSNGKQRKRRKSASPLLSSSRTGTIKRASALSYFQPLNISFIAASNADFILFSIIWKINASTIASYFFLRFFSSSFFWLI